MTRKELIVEITKRIQLDEKQAAFLLEPCTDEEIKNDGESILLDFLSEYRYYKRLERLENHGY